jgi:putative nucleotidyltransferase with HDIG domain
MTRLAAVIPAAGLSSRMGAFKPLLDLGGEPVVARVVGLFASLGVDPVIVVTGKRGEEVGAVAQRAGGVAVPNPAFERGMFSSVLTGVEALPDDIDAFFLLPADIPLVRPETIRRLMDAHDPARPGIHYPRFLGERGHPPLIGRRLIPAILEHDGSGGLRAVLERHEAEAHDVVVADEGIVRDLDYSEEYDAARAAFGRTYPTPRECDALWAMAGGTGHVMAHCRAVAQVAVALAEALNARGRMNFDADLVRGAALTHDIGKGTKRHEEAGAELLEAHGFQAAADIVRVHFDVSLPSDESITEREVVFLADKLVRCHHPVPLENRYREKMEMYAHEPGAVEAIAGRLERARAMLARFDAELGSSAELIAREALASSS